MGCSVRPVRGTVLMLVENQAMPEDRRVWQECVTLRDAGWQVTCISPRGRRAVSPEEVVDGITLHHYRQREAGRGALGHLREYAAAAWHIGRRIRALAAAQHFDVVHASNPPDFLLLLALPLKRRGTRLVFDHHDLVPELFAERYPRQWPMVGPVVRLFERLTFRAADVVICTNESYRRVAVDRGRKQPQDVFVVRNAPDLARFGPVDSDPSLREGKPHLLAYAGVMDPHDGVEWALRALAVLHRRRSDWHAVFVGSGTAVDGCRRLAEELGLAQCVSFPGWWQTQDVQRLLSTADVCLAPERDNAYCSSSTMIKVAEYMAVGRPLVAFDLRETRFTAGEAAAYAPDGDLDAFAAHIDELLDDPLRRARMGELGRRRIVEELSWEQSAGHLLTAYDRICELVAASRPERVRMVAASRFLARMSVKPRVRWRYWFGKRSPAYLLRRSRALSSRYGLTSGKAQRRTTHFIEQLAAHGCAPTIAVPGVVLHRHAPFLRVLVAGGVELAVHGYDHVDFHGLSHEERSEQFSRSVEEFAASGLDVVGFRCPYLSYAPSMRTAVPAALHYSSNEAVWWEVGEGAGVSKDPVLRTLRAFYAAREASTAPVVPHWSDGLLEIPVSLPDDLQLLDGLHLDPEAVARRWRSVLEAAHERGEIFVLQVHPETAELCGSATEAVLDLARALRPSVWVTQLRDVAGWWRERAGACVEVSGRLLRIEASQRTTVLLRGDGRAAHRAGEVLPGWSVLADRAVVLPSDELPFLAVPPDAPAEALALLRNEGYVVRTDELASRCATVLDQETLAKPPHALLDHVEQLRTPLLRFWRWPDGARAAFCVTADLDALSLGDYMTRLSVRSARRGPARPSALGPAAA